MTKTVSQGHLARDRVMATQVRVEPWGEVGSGGSWKEVKTLELGFGWMRRSLLGKGVPATGKTHIAETVEDAVGATAVVREVTCLCFPGAELNT